MGKEQPVKVRAIVCLRCKQSIMGSKPVEMEHVTTTEAAGLENHLIGTFKCPKCKALVGYIFEPVRVMQDGSTTAIPIEKLEKKDKI